MRMRTAVVATVLAGTAVSLTACHPTTSSSPVAGSAATASALPADLTAVGSPSAADNILIPDSPAPSQSSVAPTSVTPSSRPSAIPTPAAAPSRTTEPPRAVASGTAGGQGGGQSSGQLPSSFGYSASADAAAAISAATSQAKSDGKNVLLDFGASWCGNCKAVDKLYADSQVQSVLNASYHLVQVDIGDHSTTNMSILQKYDSSGSYAMPVLIVVTPSGAISTDTNKSKLPSLTTSGFLSFLRTWAP